MIEIYFIGVAMFATGIYLLYLDDIEEDSKVYSAAILGVLTWPVVFTGVALYVLGYYIKREWDRRKKNGNSE